MTAHIAAIASPEDYAECRRVMQQASKNYSFASRFLPGDKQHHVEALYALMRVGDDRVDAPGSPGGFVSSLEGIEAWEETYWTAFRTGHSPDPVMRAYLNSAIECGIPSEVMVAYFRAMKGDLTITRFPTFDDLMHYMEGSALTVGRAMTYILGVRAPYTIADTLPYADSLAVAMQLTNFWRDVGQDWGIGRVYIPQEDLRRFDVSEDDIGSARITSSFVALMEFEIERTERYFRHARSGVARLASGRWGVMSGLEIYRAILFDIRHHGYDVFTRRSGTTRLQKIGLVFKARWLTLVYQLRSISSINTPCAPLG
jgi:phytoene synthase